MEYDRNRIFKNKKIQSIICRRSMLGFLGLLLLIPLSACGQGGGKMKKEIILDVVMYSNVDRVITNIIFNDTDLGVMNKYGSTGTVAGVVIPFGVQKLEWTLGGPKGTPRNGELMKVKNELVIFQEKIPPRTRYLGLHLYPDDTAEITFHEYLPEITERGKNIRSNRK
ncbi:hypothetical protein [Janthinobacterium sp. GW458P]|uniref:hypothetical protein n=1 Tax=Janthinobacterium sp. GW458P TaxID=1981504 RepID=UPI001120FEA3|nr:hypothetical protein [Janthinobacterium sp. GW458P]MBE3024332.1 hypothetical protein [Janthinobacterium sp. GW458P]